MGLFNGNLQSVPHTDTGVSSAEFSNDLEVLRSKVDELASQLTSFAGPSVQGRSTDMQLVREAKRIYNLRREVDKIFAHDGFSRSPAWDIMLDLFEARCNNKDISVSSAGIGASCPGTTALRWLTALENQGLISRSNDPTDKRRTMISLTTDGYAKTAKALRHHLKR